MSDLEQRLRSQLPDIAATVTVETPEHAGRQTRARRLIATASMVVVLLLLAVGVAWTRLDSTNPGTPKTRNGSAALSVIAAATDRTRTFRFSQTIEHPGVRGSTSIVGVADVERSRALITLSLDGMPGGRDLLFAGGKLFERTPNRAVEWCTYSSQTSPGSGVNPIDALSSLRDAGRAVHRVGSDRVRGVETTHYRVTGDRALDIWVDRGDLLRRLRWTHGKNPQTDTTELYDFGARVSIPLPKNARPCPIPTGATLGTIPPD